ncbi:MAG: patatin-like phospholipase family protein [Candidatus Marinimicrobia bacterium]|nr:patatin-like phospholipase family protein [Candidatus Neomarinimicrobiota bacterium]
MKTKIGLALGGGGARGMAHLGIIKVLQKNNIPIDFIAGTSMGAIIGAMYAQNPDIEAIIKMFDEYFEDKDYADLGLERAVPGNKKDPTIFHQFVEAVGKRVVLNFAISRQALLQKNTLDNAIQRFVKAGQIENTEIPFYAVCSDLNSGEPVVYNRGDIQKAVKISASIPVYFPPVAENGKLLTDGGVTSPVPVNEMEQTDADIIIAASMGRSKYDPLNKPKLLNIITRMQQIKGSYLAHSQMEKADIMIEPEFREAHWSEFLRYKEFIEIGEKEARKKIDHISELIKNKQSFIRRFFRFFQNQ